MNWDLFFKQILSQLPKYINIEISRICEKERRQDEERKKQNEEMEKIKIKLESLKNKY